MYLQSERLYLRPPDKDHVEWLLRWLNDPEVFQYLLRSRPLGRAEEEEWLAGLHKRSEDMVFVIEVKEGIPGEAPGAIERQPIGICGLHRMSSSNRSAELGICIGEKAYWNRGFGREAMGLLCGYGFEILNLNRIGLSVFEYNERGRRCYEKVGFRMEGRRRQAKYWRGRYWDALEMGLLASEWVDRHPLELPQVLHLCQVD
ncbi:MAG: GNAT family N-acetyltransferase [Planctomycetes bacterium]|nr:GNAT family N-acetyltransferase [Planctomycetota bacterium]